MGFAISLRSDHPSAGAVYSLWDQIGLLENQPSMASLNYPPHITLAIYDGDVVSTTEAQAALQLAARELDTLTLTFNFICNFAGPPMVLWADPQPKIILQRIHSNIHSSINPIQCRPYYRPGSWTPHCTLGTNIKADQQETALSFAAGFEGGMAVCFDALDLISFPPLTPVEMIKLPPRRG